MKKRILAIDDDEDIRISLKLLLEKSNYQVDTAKSGEIGCKMQENTKYDLIFLDLNMPGINGIEALRKIRKTNNQVPVYIITTFYQEFFDELEKASEEGLDFEIINKPLSSDIVVSVVTGKLEKPQEY